MIVHGVTVPDRVIDRAAQFIAKHKSFKSMDLSLEIGNEMPGLDGFEASNRILQKYRKANLLVHVGGGLWIHTRKSQKQTRWE